VVALGGMPGAIFIAGLRKLRIREKKKHNEFVESY
jgi:hypothetical protein